MSPRCKHQTIWIFILEQTFSILMFLSLAAEKFCNEKGSVVMRAWRIFLKLFWIVSWFHGYSSCYLWQRKMSSTLQIMVAKFNCLKFQRHKNIFFSIIFYKLIAPLDFIHQSNRKLASLTFLLRPIVSLNLSEKLIKKVVTHREL